MGVLGEYFSRYICLVKRPYWYKILKHFENNNYVQNGLTIPFLIGARAIVEPTESLFTIDELLDDINESDISITFMRCGNINEYIIGLLDTETENYIKQYPKSYDVIGNIVCSDHSLNGITDLSGIAILLNGTYQDLLNNENYSKNNGDWGDFTSKEKLQLAEVSDL